MRRDVEGVDLRGSSYKLATYHALFAVTFDTSARASARLPLVDETLGKALVSSFVSARATQHQPFPAQGTQTQGGDRNLEFWELSFM